MKLTIDRELGLVRIEDRDGSREVPLYSREGFELISNEWLRVGWNQKYVYTFSWMGRPIIQLPEDVIRIQEVIHSVQPDVIIETGVAHGGSLVLYASLCKALGRGRVIGIDIEVRPHNRRAIEEHPLTSYITLVEGSSIAPDVVRRVHEMVAPGERVLVLLDSNHSRAHVRAELDAYHDLVTPGSYIVATDGIMELVADVPRAGRNWSEDNPSEAARQFAKEHPEFALEQPSWPFNESELTTNVTHWPTAYLRRKG